VGVALSVDDQRTIHVAIRDTGSGMPPDVLARATEPFFTTKPIGIGTGLGLSVCANVVRSLGGELKLESAVGEGTVVRVSLKAANRPAGAGTSVPPASAGRRVRKRVLLVDDDPLVLRGLTRLLRDHDVTSVNSGRDALAILEHDTSFDVILCDLMMPDLTGADVYDRIEKLGRGIEDHVVFLTGGTFTDQLGGFLERVKNPRYIKPIRQTDIDAILVRDGERTPQ
jgi:CheY-like chemotaxis protein